jgi:hypothetical protein
LFLLFGSSASGKTSVLSAVRGRFPDLAVHDFDEIGVPSSADTPWRHHANEAWVQRALRYQDRGTDLLLGGQTPFGELLATPSATLLDGLPACLLDCDDDTRVARLAQRGQEWFDRSGADVQADLNWAAWMRHHANDSTWRVDVIRHPHAEAEMRWGRWTDWQRGDQRWRVAIVDTSASTISEVVDEVARWITLERSPGRSRIGQA